MSSHANALPPSVVLVHHPDDTHAGLRLAAALRQDYGVDVWVLGWEVAPGDNIVERVEEGLERADGGLVLLSQRALAGWDREIYAALIASITRAERRRSFVMPVLLDADVPVPPLLLARAPNPADDAAGIARAILRHVGRETGEAPLLGPQWRPASPTTIALTLRRDGDHLITAVGDRGYRCFLPAAEADRLRRVSSTEVSTPAFGERLGMALAGTVGAVMERALDPTATRGEVVLEIRGDADSLGLAWEGADVGNFGPLGLIPGTTTVRVLPGTPRAPAPIPGPLRILIAAASPADDLDVEAERAVIHQALAGSAPERYRGGAHGLGRIRVVFADESAATLAAIAEHLDAEPFHILHLSAHPADEGLLLEDLDGRATPTPIAALGKVLVSAKFPPPVVVLTFAETAEPRGQGCGIAAAQALVAAGVPIVVTMLRPVSGGYVTELARHFYHVLALSGAPAPARALAEARRRVEQDRREQAARGQQFAAERPEYGAPILCAAEGCVDVALYDGTRPWAPVDEPPQLQRVAGLTVRPIGWMVGQRSAVRRLRRALIGEGPGALLVGMGGLGKSTLATTVLGHLAREGWSVVSVVGAFTLPELARLTVQQLDAARRTSHLSSEAGAALARLRGEVRRDELVLADLRTLLTHAPLVLLLDNFEDNLVSEAAGAIREGNREVVRALVAGARRGSLLITCRYDVAGVDELERIDLAPLPEAAAQRLLWRLPGLRQLAPEQRDELFASLGTHPRVLEFADALVRARSDQWSAVFPDICARIEALARRSGEPLPGKTVTPVETSRFAAARRLAAEDVLLDALLATLDLETRRFLNAIAVYRRGVPGDALAAVAAAIELTWDDRCREAAVARLRERTLLAATGPGTHADGRAWTQGWLVHRWTATELHTRTPAPAAAHDAAATWWYGAKGLGWDNGIEVIEHRLAAGRLQDASTMARALVLTAHADGRNLAALSLGERLLAGLHDLPGEHALWLYYTANCKLEVGEVPEARRRLLASVAALEAIRRRQPTEKWPDHYLAEALALLVAVHHAVGETAAALERAREALVVARRCSDGDDMDVRQVAGACETVGDLLLERGDFKAAKEHFHRGFVLRQSLARKHTDKQRAEDVLLPAFARLAQLHVMSGDLDTARQLYTANMMIRQRQWQNAPRANHAESLVNAYQQLAVVLAQMGQLEEGRQCVESGLALLHALARHEPENTTTRQRIPNFLNMLGEIERRLGHEDGGQLHTEQSVDTAREAVDTDNIGSQHILVHTLINAMNHNVQRGDLAEARKRGEEAYARARALVAAAPDVAEHHQTLYTTVNNLEYMARTLREPTEIRRRCEEGLPIARWLVEHEPEHAARQIQFVSALTRVANCRRDAGEHRDVLPMREELVRRLTDLVNRGIGGENLQRDLFDAYYDLADAHEVLGQPAAARRDIERSLAALQPFLAREPARIDLQRYLGHKRIRLAGLCEAAEDLVAARTLGDAAIPVWRKLVATDPGDPRHQRDLFVALYRRGHVALKSEVPRAALPYFSESIALCRALLARAPRDAKRIDDLIEALRGLAQTLEACDEPARAAELLREAAALTRCLLEAEPPAIDPRQKLADILVRLAILEAVLGHRDVSLALHRECVAAWEAIAARLPGDFAVTRGLLCALLRLARALRESDEGAESAESIVQYERASSLARRLVAAAPGRHEALYDLHVALIGLGEARSDADEPEPARRAFTDAIAAARTLYAADPENFADELVDGLGNMGGLLIKLDEPKAAADCLSEAIAVRERHLGEPPELRALWHHAVALDRLAELETRRGEHERARDLLVASAGHRRHIVAAQPTLTAAVALLLRTLNLLAHAHARVGDRRTALGCGEEALTLARKLVAAEPGEDAWQERLGTALVTMSDYDAPRRLQYLDAAVEVHRARLCRVPEAQVGLVYALVNRGNSRGGAPGRADLSAARQILLAMQRRAPLTPPLATMLHELNGA